MFPHFVGLHYLTDEQGSQGLATLHSHSVGSSGIEVVNYIPGYKRGVSPGSKLSNRVIIYFTGLIYNIYTALI
jgi:hypothetical protein